MQVNLKHWSLTQLTHISHFQRVKSLLLVPLGVTIIGASVVLFGLMFPLVANKHRLKMLNLSGNVIRAAKTQREEAVHMKMFADVFSALKIVVVNKASFLPK